MNTHKLLLAGVLILPSIAFGTAGGTQMLTESQAMQLAENYVVHAVSLRGWRLAARYPLDGFIGLYLGGKGSIAEVWLAGKNGGQDVLLDRIFLGTGALQKRFATGLADLSRATGLPVLEPGEAT